MNEKATIHRYLAADLEGDGIPEGTLVACIDGDCDEDKKAICFSLPDLRDPVCNAYLTDLGPVLATIEVTPRGIEPYGFAPAGSSDVLPAIVRAEELERARAAGSEITARVAEAIAKFLDGADLELDGPVDDLEWHLENDSDPTLVTATEYDDDSATGRYVVFRLTVTDVCGGAA